ncbi:MAG: NepR family anti-sigma factor [Pseudomonadota bacterium]
MSKLKTNREANAPSAPPLPDEAVDAVSKKLKSDYGKLLSEPVPDRFLELLNQLDQKPAESAQAQSTDDQLSKGE